MNRRKKTNICFLGLILALIVSISTSAMNVVAAEKEVKIGAIAGLSGPGSDAMMLLDRGAALAAEWINDNGGLWIKGDTYKIKLISEDYKMSPGGAIAAANKLVFKDKVKFILGPVIPPFKAAISKITEENKVLRLDPTGQAGEVFEVGESVPYTFVTGMEIFIQDPTLFLKDYPDIRTVALIGPDDPSVNKVGEALRGRFESMGVTVLKSEVYPIGTNDFYPVLTNILMSRPDALIQITGIPNWIGNIVKQARELDFTGPIGCFTGGADPTVIRKIAGREYSTDIWVMSYALKDPGMTPMIKEISRLGKNKYGEEINYDYLMGWETLWVLAQAIERAQSLDPVVVKSTFEKMVSIQTITGKGRMGGIKTYNANHVLVKPQPIARIMNGEVKHIGWFTPEIP